MSTPDMSFASLDPDGADRFQRLRAELGITAFGLNLIVLQPRQRLRVHMHEHQEEVYLILAGELTLIVEGNEHVLGQGQLARVGPAVRRQLINRGPDRLEVLAIGGSGEHESRDAHAWTSWDEGGDGRSPQEVPLPLDLPEQP